MPPTHGQRIARPPGRRTSRAARAGACLAMLAAALHSGCDERIDRPEQSAIQGVPIIRVRLTHPAVSHVEVATKAGYRLTAGGRLLAESDKPMPATLIRRQGGTWRLPTRTADGGELLIQPRPGGAVRLGRVDYRGTLRLLAAGDEQFVAVNHVNLESYLAGVLSKELYRTWAPQAYRALAVAARTFALYQMTTFGTRNEYDLGDTQGSQVYGGLPAETAKAWSAVWATHGVVLACGTAGQERIFLAQYSACCGGRVNGAYVIRKAHRVECLEGGQECTDCADCPRYRWPAVRIPKADIQRALAARYPSARSLRGLAGLRVATRTPHGRAVWVDAVAPGGASIRVRAEDVRLSLLSHGPPAARKLYSMNCDFVDRGRAIEFRNGRGFGHGVGLCQWGAQGKARKGWTAERILQFYYPGAKLYRVH